MRKRKTKLSRYKIVPLVLTGLLTLALLTLVTLFLWTLFAYLGRWEMPHYQTHAALLYLVLIFLSCAFMTRLIRGGTVFPTLALCVTVVVLTLFLSPETVHFWPAVKKLLLTLVAGVLGFVIGKLSTPKKAAPPRKKASPSGETGGFREQEPSLP